MSDESDSFEVNLPDIIEIIIEKHCPKLSIKDVIDHGKLFGKRSFTVDIRNITSAWTNWSIYCIAHEITVARTDGMQVPKLLEMDPISMFEPSGTDALIKLLKKLNVVLL